jgi:hypothetical protein
LEKTPEEAVQNFVDQQLEAFKEQIITNSTYSDDGIFIKDADGVPLDTEISGTLPPSQPISQEQPTSAQTPQQTNSPISRPASSGTTARFSFCCRIALYKNLRLVYYLKGR